MAYKKYNSSNNAFALFNLPISDTDTTCVLKGKYNRLPTSNFILKASHISGGVVTGRENIYVTTRTGATCTGLVRAYEPVPTDDNATTNIQQALNFSADDIVEGVISAEVIVDMQNEISTKLPTVGGLNTGYGTDKHKRINRVSGNEETKAVTTGSSFVSTDLFRVEKASGNYEDIAFSVLQNALSPSSVASISNTPLIETVATNDPIAIYKIPLASETPLANINVGDVAGNAIQTIYDTSTGTSTNSVSFYTNKVSPANNLVVRAVTVDGSGVATTTLVNANATQTIAPASVTAGGVTTFTFPASFTCGVAGTKFAWQLCQGTFASPIISGVAYYNIGFNVGDTPLFTELSTIISSASSAGQNIVWGASLISARRISVRGFIGAVSMTIGTACKVGIKTFNPGAGGAGSLNEGIEIDFTVTATGTTHIFPNPIILEQGECLYVRTVSAISVTSWQGTMSANADVASINANDGNGTNWHSVISGFLTTGVGEVQRTSGLSNPYYLKKGSTNNQLSLVNQVGYAGGAFTFGQFPKIITGGNLVSSGLSSGSLYSLSASSISLLQGLFYKSVGKAIDTATIAIDSILRRTKVVSLNITAPLYVEGTIQYSITTAAASSYTLQYSFDLKTWTAIESIGASATITNRQITVPACFIRGVITGTVSVNSFNI